MKPTTLPTVFLLAALASAPALANFSGGPKEEPPRPSSPGISSVSLSPREEAERLYRDGRDEVAKAEKDLADGKAKNAEKKYKKALDRGERAVAIDPEYHEAWNLIGYSSRHLKNYDHALVAYEKCLALKPDYAPAREYLGEAYLEMGKPDKAREQLAWLQRVAAASEEARDLAREIAKYERAHSPAGADSSGARPDSSAMAPADTSASSGGWK